MTYYFLSSSLTPLEYGDTPDTSFLFLYSRFEENLSSSDMKEMHVLRKYYDLLNIKYLLQDEELDHRGILNRKELESALAEESYFELYVFDYLNSYEDDRSKILNFSSLLNQFFKEEEKKASGFLKEYLKAQRNWRLILTGFRSKKQKKDVSAQLKFEDPYDETVSMILGQKDSPHFEAPEGYEELYEMLLTTQDSPIQQYKNFGEYQFRKIKEMVEDKLFSLDYLVAYAVLMTILEDLHALNKQQGEMVLNTIVKDIA